MTFDNSNPLNLPSWMDPVLRERIEEIDRRMKHRQEHGFEPTNQRPCHVCGQMATAPQTPGEWEYNEHPAYESRLNIWRRAQIRVPAPDDRDGDEGLRFHPYGWGEDEYYKEGPSDEPQWWPTAAWRPYQGDDVLSIVETTRQVTETVPTVINGETFPKKVKVTIPAIEVQYGGVGVAIFTRENTKGSLLEAVQNYLQTHGYLAKWHAERRKQRPLDLGWDDSMVVDPRFAIAHVQALRVFKPTL